MEEEAGPGLELVNLDLLDRRDGYAIPADSRFLPGETIHVYFQIGGYQVGREFRISLTYEMRALDPGGEPFFAAEGGKVDTELAPQDEMDAGRALFAAHSRSCRRRHVFDPDHRARRIGRDECL